MKRAVQWLTFLIVASCAVLSANAAGDAHVARWTPYIHGRDILPDPKSSSSSTTQASSTTTKSDSSSSTTSSDSKTSISSSSPSSSTPNPTSTPPPTTSSPAGQSTTPSNGETKSQIPGGTSFVVVPGSTTSSSATPSSTGTSGGGSDDSSISKGSIIGLSVAGGVAVVGIISFFIWKFTRKRFSDFDDSEAIKWPELNSHGEDVHALPTNSTGRAGFGAENDSELNLARAPSPSLGGGYAHSVAASSAPDVYHQDPYAVPPLPHLNPNQPQPYHDDPAMYGQPGFYDPYRGPVPNTFGDGMSDGHGMEAIPMTQMARTRSPGPQMMYDMQGRASPAPQAGMVMGVPAAYAMGRASPAPSQSPYTYGPR